MNERPEWSVGDTFRSVREVASIVRVALAQCIIDAADWADKKTFDRFGTEDE